jgi:glycosyltransferase involved in cell wall biosynthesis
MRVRRSFATIPPIVDDLPRPLWSVLIPTWNCSGFLRTTLESVLAQDPGPERMEIIVVDDASSDSPGDVIREIAGDRVRFIQQSKNIGKVRNYESGLTASRGHLIHQLHGDDFVSLGFYEAMEAAFDDFPDAGMFFCASNYVNESGAPIGNTGMEQSTTGIIDDWLAKIATYQRVQTPSVVVRRDIYERLGGFDRRLDAFEDWEMWIRIATTFPVGFLAQKLAQYRVSSGNTTTQTMLSGKRFHSVRTLFKIVDEYLPEATRAGIRRDRARSAAQYFTQIIPTMIERHRLLVVPKLYAKALSFSLHPRTFYRLLYFTINYRKFIRGTE